MGRDNFPQSTTSLRTFFSENSQPFNKRLDGSLNRLENMNKLVSHIILCYPLCQTPTESITTVPD